MAETFASKPGDKFLPNCAATPSYCRTDKKLRANISGRTENPYSYGKQMFIEFQDQKHELRIQESKLKIQPVKKATFNPLASKTDFQMYRMPKSLSMNVKHASNCHTDKQFAKRNFVPLSNTDIVNACNPHPNYVLGTSK